MKLAIVTACPSGIANSIIAAGLIEKAISELKWEASIECQSTVKPADTLTQQQIDQADCIIVAANTEVDLERFAGKKVYQSDIAQCLEDTKNYLENAVNNAKLLAPTTKGKTTMQTSKKIVAITACPTGVAHTFMAATALEDKAKSLGYEIKVETRGSVGAKNQLTAEEISAADLVIIAADIAVDLARFDGKKLYKTSTGLALKKTEQEINKGFSEATVYRHTGAATSSS
ncbi:MAG: PTS fructose-like transporter subunit IIB, partial [Psychromonas sp.]